MISGIRLTQLNHGEPLLGSSWSYEGEYGVKAVQRRLQDLFGIAKYMGFEFIIDTIRPQLDADGNLSFENNGLYSNIWSFKERLDLYKIHQSEFNIKLLLEIEFPTVVNESNWKQYAEFTKNVILSNPDILYWQIITEPEKIVNNFYKSDPISYVKLLKSINSIKIINTNLNIGAPGSYQAIDDYLNEKPNNWLSIAMGDVYVHGQPEYEHIGNTGFLPYIDFFSILGKQDTSIMDYNSFSSIIFELKSKISEKISKNLPFFSLDQGRKANINDKESLDKQGYFEIKEFLNAYKNGVYPFKNQLIDEYSDPYVWGGYFDPKIADRGILYYHMGDKTYKPAANEYHFVLNSLKDFNYVGNINSVYEMNPDVEAITLYNGNPNTNNISELPTKSVTVLWSKNYKTGSVILTPHYAREYVLMGEDPTSITNSVEIEFKSFNFIIVYQMIDRPNLDINAIEKRIGSKLSYAEKSLANMISHLPNSYNKEVSDTNYYKLLRSLALEIADAKIEMDTIKKDLYLETAEGDAIYNNFGVLVNLNKKSEWDYEKYRRLVQGITQSLLNGPTYQSIIEALKLFTNFNVNIKELYKEPDAPNIIGTDRTQFVFVVEIQKPLEMSATKKDIEDDVNYIIDIIKPAHTLRLILITLGGDENYKEHYKNKYHVEFKDSDILEQKIETELKEGIYGWKSIKYPGQIKTANNSILTKNSCLNSGIFIGPRYCLYDDLFVVGNINYFENIIKEWEEELDSICDFNGYEQFPKPSDGKSPQLDFIYDISEHKFGLDFDSMIRLRTRIALSEIIKNKPNIKPLYKLGFSTKLKDEVNINFVANEYNEKYVFRSLSNAFQFRDDLFIRNIDIPGFPATLNGMFSYSPDIVNNIQMDNYEKERYLTNDKKEEMEKDPIIENIYFEKLIDWVMEDEIVHLTNFETFNDIHETLIVEYLNSDKYKQVIDLELTSISNINNIDSWRKFEIIKLNENKHVTYVRELMDTTKNIDLPYHALCQIGNFEDNNIKVFVNGKLIPSFMYVQVGAVFDLETCIGIRFITEDSLEPGDRVTITYLVDRQVKQGDFNIGNDDTSHVIFDNYKDSFKTLYDINDIYNSLLIKCEFIKKCEDEMDKIICRVNWYENIQKPNDVINFEGPAYIDNVIFDKLIDINRRFILNRSRLNHGIMFGKFFMENTAEIHNFEKYQQIIENYDMGSHKVEMSEIYNKLVDIGVFHLDYFEDNIKNKLFLEDKVVEEYVLFDKYIKANDEYQLNSSLVNFKEKKYFIKEHKDHSKITFNTFKDIISTQNISNVNLPNVGFSEIIDLNIIDLFEYKSYLNYYEKYHVKEDYNIHKLITKHEEIKYLQDNLNVGYKFNISRFPGENKVENGQQNIDGYIINISAFPDVPIIETTNYEMIFEETYHIPSEKKEIKKLMEKSINNYLNNHIKIAVDEIKNINNNHIDNDIYKFKSDEFDVIKHWE